MSDHKKKEDKGIIESTEGKNLMQGLLDEIERVKGIETLYRELPGNAGVFAASQMKSDLEQAKFAIGVWDVEGMAIWYERLKEWKE